MRRPSTLTQNVSTPVSTSRATVCPCYLIAPSLGEEKSGYNNPEQDPEQVRERSQEADHRVGTAGWHRLFAPLLQFAPAGGLEQVRPSGGRRRARPPRAQPLRAKEAGLRRKWRSPPLGGRRGNRPDLRGVPPGPPVRFAWNHARSTRQGARVRRP